ncbi:MAG: hypothetical protein ACOCWB_01550 [Bacteroidota bacterium]
MKTKNIIYSCLIVCLSMIGIVFTSCEKEDVNTQQTVLPFSKKLTIYDKMSNSSAIIKVSSDDSVYIKNCNNTMYSLITRDDDTLNISDEIIDNECNDTSDFEETKYQVHVEFISTNIVGNQNCLGIRYNDSQLKACKHNYSGYHQRFYSSLLNPPSQNCDAVRIRNESGALCNAVKVIAYQNNLSTYMTGENDNYLENKYDMIWRYTSGGSPSNPNGGIASYVFVDCFWKNTNANRCSVSIIFYNNGNFVRQDGR